MKRTYSAVILAVSSLVALSSYVGCSAGPVPVGQTNNKLVGSEHLPVGVSREQEKASPLSGSWEGPADAFELDHHLSQRAQTKIWVAQRAGRHSA